MEELKNTNSQFREFIELKEDIILKDHVINADLQHVHTQALGPIIDTSFHRGPEVAWWMMGDILEQQGLGDYDNTIPYHHDNDNTSWHEMATGQDKESLQLKEEILTKFNQLVEGKGQGAVNQMIRDAKIAQHKHDIEQNALGNNAKGEVIERQKHLEGWTNRADAIIQNNNFSLVLPFSKIEVNLSGEKNDSAVDVPPPIEKKPVKSQSDNKSGLDNEDVKPENFIDTLKSLPVIGAIISFFSPDALAADDVIETEETVLEQKTGNSKPADNSKLEKLKDISNNIDNNKAEYEQLFEVINSIKTLNPEFAEKNNLNQSLNDYVRNFAKGEEITLPDLPDSIKGKLSNNEIDIYERNQNLDVINETLSSLSQTVSYSDIKHVPEEFSQHITPSETPINEDAIKAAAANIGKYG